MGDRKRLTEEELAAQQGEPLPNREVMSVITSEPQPLPATSGDDIHIYPIEGERTLPIEEEAPADKATETTEPEPLPPASDDPQPVPPASGGAYFDESDPQTTPSDEGAGGPSQDSLAPTSPPE